MCEMMDDLHTRPTNFLFYKKSIFLRQERKFRKPQSFPCSFHVLIDLMSLDAIYGLMSPQARLLSPLSGPTRDLTFSVST